MSAIVLTAVPGRLLTVFVDSVPITTRFRIWDVFLFEGPKIPFRFALGLLMQQQSVILKLNNKQRFSSYFLGR